MALDGVEGVGLGRDSEGREAIVLYIRDEGCKNASAPPVEGYPVKLVRTGEIVALQLTPSGTRNSEYTAR